MRSPLALVLFLALGACALPQQRSRTFTPYAPLKAHITAISPAGPLFHVNRPAYVAMFYITPGAGVSMLYPGFGSGSLDGRVFAGSHFANTRLHNRHQYLFTRSTYGQPRFYFMIASDRPLNVGQFGAFGDALPFRLAGTFGSFSAYSTMERLARLALPSLVDDGSWTTDLYVEWPSVLFAEPGRNRVLVRCNGYAMYVPRGYLSPVRSVLCDAAQDAERRERRQGEEEGEENERPVVKPKAREPLPADRDSRAAEARALSPAARKALIDRITASSQLSRPALREDGGPADAGRANGRSRPGLGGDAWAGNSGARGSSGATSAGTRSADAGSSGRTAATPSSRPSSGGSAASPPSGGGDSSGSSSSGQARSRPGIE